MAKKPKPPKNKPGRVGNLTVTERDVVAASGTGGQGFSPTSQIRLYPLSSLKPEVKAAVLKAFGN